MSIIISYQKFANNWYVGELYDMFAKYMLAKHSDVSVVDIQELSVNYNEPFNFTSNRLPSIFNIYNIIVYNTIKKTGYVHSLADYAHAMLSHDQAIDKLGIRTFSFCSNLTDDIVNNAKQKNINVTPSFYILENLTDYANMSECYAANRHRQNNCYFNGLSYGNRKFFIDCLNTNNFFIMKDKSKNTDYLSKINYYQTISQYEYGISLNGAAQICYRDLEYFYLKILCIREPLNILTKDQILPNVHYLPLINNEVLKNIFDIEKYNKTSNDLREQILSIKNSEKKFILDNAREWFDNNAVSSKQINFIYESLVKNEVI